MQKLINISIKVWGDFMVKVKWGVIGAGGIADRRTIPGIMSAHNAELIAVMDVNIQLAEKIREKYNAKKAYDTIEALLNDPEVEAVYIASPVVYHKHQVLKAAMSGKHILVEKPIALTVTEGEEIVRECKEKNILAAAGLMMRYHAYHQKMKELIETGKIGQIVSCRAQLTCWYPQIQGAWRQDKNLSGGGAMMDLAIHCIDLIQYVTNSKAVKVSGMVGTKTFGYSVDDSGSVLFETDNGAYCYVDVNFNIPDDAAKCRFEIYGTKGSMLAEGTISQVEGGKLDVVLSNNSKEYDAQQDRVDVSPIDIDVTFGDMYTKEIVSFSNSILNGNAVEVSIEDALQVQKVIEAAYDSSSSQKMIQL